MLILKIYVNKDKIDEIHIHNEGLINEELDIWKYKIIKPKGYKRLFYHVRRIGYEKLVVEVLKFLSRRIK